MLDINKIYVVKVLQDIPGHQVRLDLQGHREHREFPQVTTQVNFINTLFPLLK